MLFSNAIKTAITGSISCHAYYALRDVTRVTNVTKQYYNSFTSSDAIEDFHVKFCEGRGFCCWSLGVTGQGVVVIVCHVVQVSYYFIPLLCL